MTTMQTITLQKYQTRARNFYRNHCGSENPNSAQICAALLACASDYRPNSFGTLKSALAHDQKARGNHHATKAIKQLINPVETQDQANPLGFRRRLHRTGRASVNAWLHG